MEEGGGKEGGKREEKESREDDRRSLGAELDRQQEVKNHKRTPSEGGSLFSVRHDSSSSNTHRSLGSLSPLEHSPSPPSSSKKGKQKASPSTKILILSSHQKKVAYFQKRFKADKDDKLIHSAVCAYLRQGLLHQGRMYISKKLICFATKIRGFHFRFSVDDVVVVFKRKTALLFDNALELEMKSGKKYFFGSLLNRNRTFKIMESAVSKKSLSPLRDTSLQTSPENDIDETDLIFEDGKGGEGRGGGGGGGGGGVVDFDVIFQEDGEGVGGGEGEWDDWGSDDDLTEILYDDDMLSLPEEGGGRGGGRGGGGGGVKRVASWGTSCSSASSSSPSSFGSPPSPSSFPPRFVSPSSSPSHSPPSSPSFLSPSSLPSSPSLSPNPSPPPSPSSSPPPSRALSRPCSPSHPPKNPLHLSRSCSPHSGESPSFPFPSFPQAPSVTLSHPPSASLSTPSISSSPPHQISHSPSSSPPHSFPPHFLPSHPPLPLSPPSSPPLLSPPHPSPSPPSSSLRVTPSPPTISPPLPSTSPSSSPPSPPSSRISPFSGLPPPCLSPPPKKMKGGKVGGGGKSDSFISQPSTERGGWISMDELKEMPDSDCQESHTLRKNNKTYRSFNIWDVTYANNYGNEEMKKDPSFFENILGLPPRYDQPCEHFYPFFEQQGAILLSSLMINASKEMVFSSFFANSSLWLFKMHNGSQQQFLWEEWKKSDDNICISHTFSLIYNQQPLRETQWALTIDSSVQVCSQLILNGHSFFLLYTLSEAPENKTKIEIWASGTAKNNTDNNKTNNHNTTPNKHKQKHKKTRTKTKSSKRHKHNNNTTTNNNNNNNNEGESEGISGEGEEKEGEKEEQESLDSKNIPSEENSEGEGGKRRESLGEEGGEMEVIGEGEGKGEGKGGQYEELGAYVRGWVEEMEREIELRKRAEVSAREKTLKKLKKRGKGGKGRKKEKRRKGRKEIKGVVGREKKDGGGGIAEMEVDVFLFVFWVFFAVCLPSLLVLLWLVVMAESGVEEVVEEWREVLGASRELFGEVKKALDGGARC